MKLKKYLPKKKKEIKNKNKRGIWLEHAKKLLTPSSRREDKTRKSQILKLIKLFLVVSYATLIEHAFRSFALNVFCFLCIKYLFRRLLNVGFSHSWKTGGRRWTRGQLIYVFFLSLCSHSKVRSSSFVKKKPKKKPHLHMTSQNLTTRFEESPNSHESCRVELIFLPTFAVRGDRNQPVLSTVKMTKEACTSWCCTNIYLFTNKTTTKHG